MYDVAAGETLAQISTHPMRVVGCTTSSSWRIPVAVVLLMQRACNLEATGSGLTRTLKRDLWSSSTAAVDSLMTAT